MCMCAIWCNQVLCDQPQFYQSIAHKLFKWTVHPFIRSAVYSFIGFANERETVQLLVHSLIDAFVRSLVHQFIRSVNNSAVQLFIRSSSFRLFSTFDKSLRHYTNVEKYTCSSSQTHSFVHSFIYSFIHSFICLFVHSITQHHIDYMMLRFL